MVLQFLLFFGKNICLFFIPRPLFHHSRLVCQSIKALAAISVPVYHASHSRVTKKNLFIILRYYFSQTLLSMEKENLREHTGHISHFVFSAVRRLFNINAHMSNCKTPTGFHFYGVLGVIFTFMSYFCFCLLIVFTWLQAWPTLDTHCPHI